MIGSLLLWLLGIIIFGGLALYSLGSWLFANERRPDEIHYVKADDGWEIAVRRYRPRGERRLKTPVILQHGLGANHRDFDLDDKHSLALLLASEGYDCFLPDLRGIGGSRYRKAGWPNKWHINFDDFVQRDLPAVIDHILAQTGAKKVHYIGHSMGGMIGYALCMGDYATKIKTMTSFAGPAMFDGMSHFKPLVRWSWALNPFPAIHNGVWGRILAPLSYLFPVVGNKVVNPENMNRAVLANACANVLAPVPRRLLLQFGGWVELGEWGSHLPESYQSGFERIKTPIYCLVGTKDFWCPLKAITPVTERVSSRKKRLRVFSKENGDSADYGHGDIVVGRTAPDEIFPTVRAWLFENDRVSV